VKLEHYIYSGGKRLRCGYTTGTCAAAAAGLAAERLLGGQWPAAAAGATPAGIRVIVEPEDCSDGPGRASCAVRKDAGDDCDVTDGLLVYASVRQTASPGIVIEGGEGIGRVTRPGLDQPVGRAAINSVPRRMIEEQLAKAAGRHGYEGGFEVTISAPEGAERAQKTFNSRLGITGGLSILGTTGIVRPMSEQALVDSVRAEMKMRRAEGASDLAVVPGNIGEAFVGGALRLRAAELVQCSNFIGEAIDCAAALGFKSLLLVGHAGKLVKLAAGIMNTHSRWADGRAEIFTAHAALCGATRELAARLMDSLTADEALDALEEAGLLDKVLKSIIYKIGENLRRRAGRELRAEAVMFTAGRGVLGMTGGAAELLRLHAEE
jgi:cobalt-precorrin-5B (C1)-methyltransferase